MINKLSLLTAVIALAACSGEGGNSGTAAASNAPVAPVAPPAGGDWTKLVTQTPEGGMLMGNPNAKVRVIEFASMTCPACAAFAADGEPKLKNGYVKTGQVAYEFRNYVRDPLDLTMSLVARCAGATPAFFALTSQLFADQKNIFARVQAVPAAQQQQLQSLPPAQQFGRMAQFAGLQEWAAQRGLPSAKTSACLAQQGEVDRLVQITSDGSSQYNVQGTPTFVVNGTTLGTPTPGQSNWQALEAAIRGAMG